MEFLIGVVVLSLIASVWYFKRRTVTVTWRNEDSLTGTRGTLVSLDSGCSHKPDEKKYVGRRLELIDNMYVRFLDNGQEKCFYYGYKIRR